MFGVIEIETGKVVTVYGNREMYGRLEFLIYTDTNDGSDDETVIMDWVWTDANQFKPY